MTLYIEDKYGYHFLNELNYTHFTDFVGAKEYKVKNPDDLYITYDKGGNTNMFTPLDNVVNLALDTADNLDLDRLEVELLPPNEFSNDGENMRGLYALKYLCIQRIDYVRAKEELGKKYGVEHTGTLTNAQLVSRVLGLKKRDKVPFTYEPPFPCEKNDLLDFFRNIDNEENYTCTIGGCECVFGRGGVHGSTTSLSFISPFIVSTSSNDFTTSSPSVCYYFDISSYYPSLIYKYRYLDSKVFDEMYEEHIKNKTGATKLLLNTTSGMLEHYDPNSALSMRLTGQLLIYFALKDLERRCETFKLLNLNTDGFIVCVDEDEEGYLIGELISSLLNEISTVKIHKVDRLYLKDINNLIMTFTDDEVKAVGSINYGVRENGKYSVNNSNTYSKGITIRDMFSLDDFPATSDITAYRVSKGKADHLELGGENIGDSTYVYASKNGNRLYRVNEDGSKVAVSGVPNKCTTDYKEIDLEYYENESRKLLIEYGGKTEQETTTQEKPNSQEKEVKQMSELNLLQKLNKARKDFLALKVSKSGHNTYMLYDYFTLDDIVPGITQTFNAVGITAIFNFTVENATLTLYNNENPDEHILFTSPNPSLKAANKDELVSGNEGMQYIGRIITYQRRYLYLMALDIVEPEIIDALPQGAENKPAPTSKKVVQDTLKSSFIDKKRDNAAAVITSGNGQADPEQIEGLKRVIDRCVKEDRQDLVAVIDKLYARTNRLENITEKDCTDTIVYLSSKLGRKED